MKMTTAPNLATVQACKVVNANYPQTGRASPLARFEGGET